MKKNRTNDLCTSINDLISDDIINMKHEAVKGNNLLVPWHESKWLVASSFFFLLPALYAGYYQLYFYSFLLMTASFVSANYWRKATNSWRRTMDLILSKIIFVVFYLKGLFAVTYFPYVLSIYVVGPLVGFFIIQSNLLWEKKNKHWVKYHFLFHVTLVYLLLIVLDSIRH